jgi:DNA-binding HxlR family transcriptional regulator
LRFGDPRVLALLQVLVLFSLQPEGFRNQHLREHYARLLGLDPTALTPGQLTYQLRRLRLHGLIERIPRSHRYRLTDFGLRATLFLSRLYARAIRPGMSLIDPQALPSSHGLQRAFNCIDKQIHTFCQEQKIAA